MHYIAAKLTSLSFRPREWACLPKDAKDDLFQRLVSAYEHLLLDTPVSGRSEGPTRPPIALGTIPPVFIVAILGSRKNIRGRVLGLLERLDINEGSWNSQVAHLIALALQPAYKCMDQTVQGQQTHSSGFRLVRPTFATCNFSPTIPEEAIVTVRYTITSADRTQEIRSSALRITNSAYIKACRATQWPLEDTLRSLGYHRAHMSWAPYLLSRSVVGFRIAMRESHA